jgi:hypothetical protein
MGSRCGADLCGRHGVAGERRTRCETLLKQRQRGRAAVSGRSSGLAKDSSKGLFPDAQSAGTAAPWSISSDELQTRTVRAFKIRAKREATASLAPRIASGLARIRAIRSALGASVLSPARCACIGGQVVHGRIGAPLMSHKGVGGMKISSPKPSATTPQPFGACARERIRITEAGNGSRRSEATWESSESRGEVPNHRPILAK